MSLRSLKSEQALRRFPKSHTTRPKERETGNDRNISLDILRLFMSFFVIGVHAKFLSDVHPVAAYLSINGIFRMSVPIFLLISGFYSFSAFENGRNRAWFKRVLYLYIFWMLFYAYFWLNPQGETLQASYIIETLLNGYAHLGYIAGLLGAGLLLYVMKGLRTSILVASIVMTFFAGVGLEYFYNTQTLSPALSEFLSNYWVSRNFLFYSFPFLMMGYLIRKCSFHRKISLPIAVVASLIGVSLLLSESYTNYRMNVDFVDNLAALFIACPAIFLLFTKLDIRGASKQLALYSVGIYFIHTFVLIVLLKLTNLQPTPLSLVAFAGSAAAAYVLIQLRKRLPFII